MAYIPPGITISETTSTSVSPILGSSANICVIGLPGNLVTTQTPITTTDVMILSGTSALPLPTLAALNSDAQLLSVTSVTDILNPSVGTPLGAGYAVNTDYTVQLGEAGPDGTQGTITRLGTGTITSGTLVAVTYTYVPSDYWNPIQLFDVGSVESRFGASWSTATNSITGQTYYTGVNSQLSMAARLAFVNGAQSVICQPLFARGTPGDPTTVQQAPTATQVGQSSTWTDTLYALRNVANLDLIVPIIGQEGNHVTDSGILSIFGAVQSHLAYMNSLQDYIVAVFGEDGTVEGIGNNASGLINVMRAVHAPSLQSNFGNKLSAQCVLLNNTVFQLPTPSGANTVVNVGGQYAAAAMAGALAARPASTSLTRKPVIGFQSISDPRSPADKNADAGAGLTVIEQVGSLVRVRQSNTLDITHGPEYSELSVVRSKFEMIASIKQTLDNEVLGNIIADGNSPLIVRSAISSVLSLLVDANIIVGYSNVQASLTSLNPTVITASFLYQAAFPVNYVKVTFALDLTAGTVTTTVGPESGQTPGS